MSIDPKLTIPPTVTTILFDLDGTLLPMDQEDFVRRYTQALAGKVAALGLNPKLLISALWKGVAAMVANTGHNTNRQVFWQVVGEVYGRDLTDYIPHFDAFYACEFDAALAACAPSPLANTCVKILRDKGYTLALATNPLFPPVATHRRMTWAGLWPEDFALITTYDNCRSCKPNPLYFKEVLEMLGRAGQQCAMIGNDPVEDGAAAELGIPVLLVEDPAFQHVETHLPKIGNLEQLVLWARQLPPCPGGKQSEGVAGGTEGVADGSEETADGAEGAADGSDDTVGGTVDVVDGNHSKGAGPAQKG